MKTARTSLPLLTRCAAAILIYAGVMASAQAGYTIKALEEIESKVQAVAEKNLPAVVVVTHVQNKGVASGSGCVITPNGLILTAAHVVADAKTLDVVFPDLKKYHAKVLGADYTRDVALAMIVEPGEFPYAELGDSKNLSAGDMVVALGHPGGFDPQRKPPVRFGRVFDFHHDHFIRTDCTLIVGDSGGPLFNLEGKVVGVHSSVGKDLSQNNDAPAEAVRANWDRLIRGDHWGQLKKPGMPKLAKEELHGLNAGAFHDMIQRESLSGKNGALQLSAKEIAAKLMACGMDKEFVGRMKDAEVVAFMQKVMGANARMIPMMPQLPAIPAEELHGMNLAEFRKRIIGDAMKNGGKSTVSAETLKNWLADCGMDKDYVAAMSDKEAMIFFAKVMGGKPKTPAAPDAPAGEAKIAGAPNPEAGEKNPSSETKPGNTEPSKSTVGTKTDSPDLEGWDYKKFRQILIGEALKNGGRLRADDGQFKKWLADCGMSKERCEALNAGELSRLVKKVMGGGDKPRVSPQELAGMDVSKLRTRVVSEAMKNGGKVSSTVQDIARWMQEAGMKKERLKSMKDEEIARLFQLIMGDAGGRMAQNMGVVPSLIPDVILRQNRDIMDAVRPSLENAGSATVAMIDGGKTLALGVIIRENGFILTKLSEIAKAKSLQARLADGRTFSAVAVKSFDDHDLAVVKIDAEQLPHVTIPGQDSKVRPGSLLFSPGSGSPMPVVGQGVLSVPDRALVKESGGYLGLALKDSKDVIEVNEMVPNGPAAKAGLKKGDRILSLDSAEFSTPREFTDQVRQYAPQTVAQIKILRDNQEMTLAVTMGDRSKLPERRSNPIFKLGTDISEKHGGFPLVFQNDQQLRPQDCGGVVLDIHGNIVGVNVARVGRVDSYAIPAHAVARLIKGLDYQTLEQKAKAPKEPVEEIRKAAAA